MDRVNENNIFFNEHDYQLACVGKNKYDSEWQAKYSSDESYLISHGKVKLTWYKCKYCNKWHLTSNN